MYRLVNMHSVTDMTGSQTSDDSIMSIADHTACSIRAAKNCRLTRSYRRPYIDCYALKIAKHYKDGATESNMT